MPSPHKKSFAAEQLALRQKNKVSPVVWGLVGVVVVVLLVGGYVIYQRSVTQKQVETEAQKIKSVAVLAFEDMTPEKNMEHLGDGMAEAIINALSTVDNLRVPARNSTFVFKGKYHDIREIGSKLDVDAVLEGSIQKSGDQLRISAQLIRVSDDQHLWSEQYDSFVIDNIFSVQDSISLAILRELKFTLMGKEKAAIVKRYTNDPDAYDLYLLGRQYVNMREIKYDYIKGIAHFSKAIEHDPYFALAYTGLAEAYWMANNIAEARRSVDKALDLDENLGASWMALAEIQFHNDFDFKAAEENYLQAVEIDPRFAEIRHRYAYFLRLMGRYEESLRENRLARELDPLMMGTYSTEMILLTRLNRDHEAMEIYRKGIDLDPDFHALKFALGRFYEKQGKYEEAIAIFKELKRLAHLGYCYAKIGRNEEAENLLNDAFSKLKKKPDDYWGLIVPVFIYAARGDADRLFEMLEKVYDHRSHSILFLKTDAEYDPYRSDSRFLALMKKVGLPED